MDKMKVENTLVQATDSLDTIIVFVGQLRMTTSVEDDDMNGCY